MTTRRNFEPLNLVHATQQVNLYIDNELLSDEERLRIKFLIENNLHYQAIYTQEKAYRETLLECCEPLKMPENRMNDIKDLISSML